MILSYSAALDLLLAEVGRLPLAIEILPLLETGDRILAKDLAAPCDLPHWDNSAMDGFALRSQDVTAASPDRPVRLPVVGRVMAGEQPPLLENPTGVACAVMTGAPIPAGFDVIVKVEDVVQEENAIAVSTPIPAGQFIRRRGEDLRQGSPLLAKGQRLTPMALMLAAAVGIGELPVWSKLPVGLISTGTEVVPWSQPTLELGQIRNSSQPFLIEQLQRLGCEVRAIAHVPDDPEQFAAIAQQFWSQGVRLLLTTGAVSMGVADFVPAALERLGCQTIFHKVAIRPGKPLLFAIAPEHQGLVLACPGNPVSTTVTAEFFLKPLLMACRNEVRSPLWLPLAESVRKPEGLQCFWRSRLTVDGKVSVDPQQSSAALKSLVESTHWAILPADTDFLSAGTPVEVRSLLV
ncbi:molybdopterin molybdotransferase MoeA [Synechococcus elongatus]|uniref:molybdopterin molybdotransferase MoeA n=1 Tax=Synechococcus elongatus TaxID=32046 RepID=UPI000F7E676E|nr:molybdopterin molybdotransferase MoeA [Synechococcus elongatus]